MLAWISASSFTFNWTEKNSTWNSCVCSEFDQTAQLRQVEAPNAWNWSLAWFWMDSCLILNGQHPKFAAIPITNGPLISLPLFLSCFLHLSERSTLCHLLESFDIVHVLTEAFWEFQFMCPDSPISTIYCTEFHHVPLPIPTQLHLFIFSTVIGLQNSPRIGNFKTSLWGSASNSHWNSLKDKNRHVLDRHRNFR